MQVILDVVGSVLIAGFVILIMANLNLNILNSSTENLYTNIAQENAGTTSEILEYDLGKIGYRTTSGISVADSNQISYGVDIDDDGDTENISYYLGDVSELSSTANPNDRVLYRQISGFSSKTMAVVAYFKLSYYDSTASMLTYAALSNQTERDKIKTVEVYLKVESSDPVDSLYQVAEWRQKIYPRNL